MKDLRGKRVLVTGGAGFLGSHLCERLLARRPRRALRRQFLHRHASDNIAHLLDNPRFELMRHDVTFPLYVEVDEIYNLACPASPIHYQFDPVQTTKTSVHGAINMLGLAKRVKAKILQASTSEVYGDPTVHPQTEDYWGNVNPIGPRACYDEGKRCAETLFFDYHRQHGLRIKVARIFNTYGPRMHPNDGRVVSNFIVQALRGEPITIYGDGKQTRSFCYVDDLVDGLIRLMDSDGRRHRPGQPRQPGRVHDPASWPRRSIALTGSRSEIEFHNAARGRSASAQAGHRLGPSIGWSPRWSSTRACGVRSDTSRSCFKRTARGPFGGRAGREPRRSNCATRLSLYCQRIGDVIAHSAS